MNEARAALIIDQGRSEKNRGFGFIYLFTMDYEDQSDYVFCPHCKENVARSTFRRHQLSGTSVKRKREVATSSSSDSDSGDECSNNIASQDPKYSGFENGKL